MPTGLASRDVSRDGHQDLLVGNAFGDLLTIFGNGDGTFQPYQRAGQNIALAVTDLNDDGEDDFIFANESLDRMSVQYSEPGKQYEQTSEDGLLAPEAVQVADLNGNGRRDFVVANNGANNVLVYLGGGDGRFERARSFPAGTNPSGITIEDLNGDQLLDLVVTNEGSNDINILLGAGDGKSWTMTSGPRLEAGAGPSSAIVREETGDGIPEIVVANSQSNSIALIPGLGGGFFDDRNPIIREVPGQPNGKISH